MTPYHHGSHQNKKTTVSQIISMQFARQLNREHSLIYSNSVTDVFRVGGYLIRGKLPGDHSPLLPTQQYLGCEVDASKEVLEEEEKSNFCPDVLRGLPPLHKLLSSLCIQECRVHSELERIRKALLTVFSGSEGG